MRENLSSVFLDNKGADEPAHRRSLISAFVIHLLESIMSELATSEIPLIWLVSVVEQAGCGMTWTENPKTGFLTTRPTNMSVVMIGCHSTITYL